MQRQEVWFIDYLVEPERVGLIITRPCHERKVLKMRTNMEVLAVPRTRNNCPLQTGCPTAVLKWWPIPVDKQRISKLSSDRRRLMRNIDRVSGVLA